MTDGTEGSPHGARDGTAQQSAATPGHYELCNVFGTPTGRRVLLPDGDALPAIPHGWSWRPVSE